MNEYLGRNKSKKKKNQLLKPLIEKFRAKVILKEIAINNRKNPKEIDL
jgi:hypothetical protein